MISLQDLIRIPDAVHQTDAVREPYTVGICNDGRLTEDIPHNEIGTLPPYSGQLQQFIK